MREKAQKIRNFLGLQDFHLEVIRTCPNHILKIQSKDCMVREEGIEPSQALSH